jgi:hypothetical protein
VLDELLDQADVKDYDDQGRLPTEAIAPLEADFPVDLPCLKG